MRFFTRLGILFFKIAFAAFIIWRIERFCRAETDGFSIARISSDLPFREEWSVPSPPAHELQAIKHILNQKFIYLGRGAQVFAFASEDGQYVMKVFQHYRMRPPPWAPFLPASFSKEKTAKRNALLQLDFDSYKIAYEKLREETGLMFLHLNKTHFLTQPITLVDKLGIAHRLDLDNLSFLLQRRGALAYTVLNDLMQAGQIEAAKRAIDSLVRLMLTRCQKGIFDKDPDFATNLGFCAGSAMQIDVGRFSLDPSRSTPEVYTIDLIHALDPFRKWLEEHHPQLADYLYETHYP